MITICIGTNNSIPKIVYHIILRCNMCLKSATKMSFWDVRHEDINVAYELNIRYAYALWSVGKGITSRKPFSIVVNCSGDQKCDFTAVFL